jgi:hypothetical protein
MIGYALVNTAREFRRSADHSVSGGLARLCVPAACHEVAQGGEGFYPVLDPTACRYSDTAR